MAMLIRLNSPFPRSISPQRDMSADAKKARVQTSMRMLKEEPVPEGYLRFRLVIVSNLYIIMEN